MADNKSVRCRGSSDFQQPPADPNIELKEMKRKFAEMEAKLTKLTETVVELKDQREEAVVQLKDQLEEILRQRKVEKQLEEAVVQMKDQREEMLQLTEGVKRLAWENTTLRQRRPGPAVRAADCKPIRLQQPAVNPRPKVLRRHAYTASDVLKNTAKVAAVGAVVEGSGVAIHRYRHRNDMMSPSGIGQEPEDHSYAFQPEKALSFSDLMKQPEKALSFSDLMKQPDTSFSISDFMKQLDTPFSLSDFGKQPDTSFSHSDFGKQPDTSFSISDFMKQPDTSFSAPFIGPQKEHPGEEQLIGYQ